MKRVILLIIMLLPICAAAYVGDNYRSFSGLQEMEAIAIDEIDNTTSLFVSPDGSDDNSGTIDEPFKTITYAISKAKCYYTIYLRSGTYNEQITVDKSNLTIRNYPNEEVIISGNGLTGTISNIIISQNLKNVKIYGLHIQDRQEQDVEAAYGIIVYGGCKDIIIQNNEITNINGNAAHKYDLYGYNAGAIVLYGNQENPIQNALIANNKIHDMDCGKSEAITTTGYVNKVDIIENDIEDIFNIGIDVAGHYKANEDPDKDYSRYIYVAGNKVINAASDIADNSGIYVDGAQGVLVERNYVTGCPFGISLDQENNISNANYHTQDIIVSSNLLVDNNKSGLRIGTSNLLSSSVFNSLIINNTIIHPSSAGSGALVIAKSHDNDIVNNVIYDKGSWHNIIYTDDGSTSEEIYNTNINNNYIYSTNHLWFVGGLYFKIAGIQYTEEEFTALPFTSQNKVGEEVSLNDDYSIVVGSVLDGMGLNNQYMSILRDYDGYLGTNSISLGYKYVDRKADTDEDIAALNDTFNFNKDYIVTGFVENFLCSCNDTDEEEANETPVIDQPTTDEVEEVKGVNEKNNPQTKDYFLLYVLITTISLLSIKFIFKRYNNNLTN